MPSAHADGEDLARLAMQDEVPAAVAVHVADCAECSRDLALIRSLLDADGPEGSDGATTDQGPSETPEVTDAWADANDSGATADHPTEVPPANDQPESPPTATTTAGRRTNPTALVVALLLFVGAILLAFFALR